MKRFLPIVMLVVAQLGCDSQEVRLQVHDEVTQETLGHVNVTLRISHPPKEFFGSRWSENKKLVEGKNNEFTFAYPIIEDVRTSLAIHKPGYYYTSYPLPQKKRRFAPLRHFIKAETEANSPHCDLLGWVGTDILV